MYTLLIRLLHNYIRLLFGGYMAVANHAISKSDL